VAFTRAGEYLLASIEPNSKSAITHCHKYFIFNIRLSMMEGLGNASKHRPAEQVGT
jgi:hypothetical protein